MLNGNDCPYDFEDFLDVPEPESRTQKPRLSFSKDDQFAQNETLHKAMNGVRSFRLRISSDGRTLVLDPQGPCNMTFTPVGVRTHHPLGRLLRERGLEPPLSFLASWEEELHCWIARYDGLTPPPGKQAAAKGRKERG